MTEDGLEKELSCTGVLEINEMFENIVLSINSVDGTVLTKEIL